MHVAKVLIYDADDNILVLRRSGTHPTYAYQPDFPGGIIEPDEDILTGLVREVQEEAGITIDPSTLKPAFTNKAVGKWTRHLYTVRIADSRPSVTISWEHDQYTWLPVSQVLQKPADPDTDSYYTHAIEWLKGSQ